MPRRGIDRQGSQVPSFQGCAEWSGLAGCDLWGFSTSTRTDCSTTKPWGAGGPTCIESTLCWSVINGTKINLSESPLPGSLIATLTSFPFLATWLVPSLPATPTFPCSSALPARVLPRLSFFLCLQVPSHFRPRCLLFFSSHLADHFRIPSFYSTPHVHCAICSSALWSHYLLTEQHLPVSPAATRNTTRHDGSRQLLHSAVAQFIITK